MNTPHTPTPGFEFPTELQDKIGQNLRSSVSKANQPVVRSVRPERQQPIIPRMESETRIDATSNPMVPSTIEVKNSKIQTQDPPITPISTEGMVSIGLPSKFAYYDFKDLYVKPFRVTHLAKLAKADDIGSAQLVCEVVSSVLATPNGDQNLGFKLSVVDFQAVLYWLRASSFSKSTMRVKSQCENPAHHAKVNSGELASQTLINESVHDVSKLQTKYLDWRPDPEKYHLMIALANGETKRVDLRPETMMDSIEFLDDPRCGDDEFNYTARIASYLDLDSAFPITEGPVLRWTLKDKMKVVEDYLTTDQALLVLEFSELVDDFGTIETVEVKCKECGHVHQLRLTIDARTFSAPRF